MVAALLYEQVKQLPTDRIPSRSEEAARQVIQRQMEPRPRSVRIRQSEASEERLTVQQIPAQHLVIQPYKVIPAGPSLLIPAVRRSITLVVPVVVVQAQVQMVEIIRAPLMETIRPELEGPGTTCRVQELIVDMAEVAEVGLI